MEGLVEFQEGFNKFPSRIFILTLCNIRFQSNHWKVIVMIYWNLFPSFTGGPYLLDLWVMPIGTYQDESIEEGSIMFIILFYN